MIQYEPLLPTHRKTLVASVRFFGVLIGLGLIGLYFLLPKKTLESGEMGGVIMLFYHLLAYLGWQPDGMTARDFGFLFLKLIAATFVLFWTYLCTRLLIDLIRNEQAFIEGVLDKKHIQVRSDNSQEGNSDDRQSDHYALTFTDANGLEWHKKVPVNFYNNLLEGDVIKFIYAPLSKIEFDVEILERFRPAENGFVRTLPSIEKQTLTAEDIKFANQNNSIYYWIGGILLFLLCVISVLIYAVPKEMPFLFKLLLFGMLAGLLYGLNDTFMKRWTLYKDIKGGYKILRVGKVMDKYNNPTQGRDACIITVQTLDTAENLVFTIEPEVFEKIVSNDTVRIAYLERTHIALGVTI
jgi:hypothetical protein